MRFHERIIEMNVIVTYIMCLVIFEEKVEKQDQGTLILSPDQESTILILDQGRYIGSSLATFQNVHYCLEFAMVDNYCVVLEDEFLSID